MAYKLQFSGLQPVGFGGRDCEPVKPNAEQRLRLSRLDFDTEEKAKASIAILASLFPNDEAFVTDFLTNKATPLEVSKLANYLLAGEDGVTLAEKAIAEQINKIGANQ